MTTMARTFTDEQRLQLATNEGALALGPLEVTVCAHGFLYSFRYQWPRGNGGPDTGEVRVIENKCLDCALQGWLRPGVNRQV